MEMAYESISMHAVLTMMYGYYQSEATTDAFVDERRFSLGRSIDAQYGDHDINEFYIWPEVLQPTEVCQLFWTGAYLWLIVFLDKDAQLT